VLAADDRTLRAEDDGKPASGKSVESYIARAFGDRLGEARAAMEALAASLSVLSVRILRNPLRLRTLSPRKYPISFPKRLRTAPVKCLSERPPLAGRPRVAHGALDPVRLMSGPAMGNG
jgi:hypothetical protein